MHQEWADTLRKKAGDPKTIVDQAVVDKFVKGLEDAGAFKQTETGQERFDVFVRSLLSHVDKVEYGTPRSGMREKTN